MVKNTRAACDGGGDVKDVMGTFVGAFFAKQGCATINVVKKVWISHVFSGDEFDNKCSCSS